MAIRVVDLTHFLDEHGVPADGPAGRAAALYGGIAACASTHEADVPVRTPIRCRRRPGHVPCPGRLVTRMRSEGPVEWLCPVCGDAGSIGRWQGSPWDLRACAPRRRPDDRRVVVDEEEYAAGLGAPALDAGAAGLLRSALYEVGGPGDGAGRIVLRAGRSALAGVAEQLAAAARHGRTRRMVRALRAFADRLQRAAAGAPGAGGRGTREGPDGRGHGAQVVRVVRGARRERAGSPAASGGGVGFRAAEGPGVLGDAGQARTGAGGRPTWVEVDLDAIRHNVATLRARLRHDCRLMAVVKAGAYGHGAGPVARAALEAGAASLGVALLEEGLELRRAGVAAPILILGWTPRARAAEVVAAGLEQAVFDLEDASALAAAARAAGRRVRLHAKLDTGMGRLGWPCRSARDADAATAAVATVAHLRGAELAGVFTHLADADGADPGAAEAQVATFSDLLASLDALGVRPAVAHCANTAALLRMPRAHFGLCRAGIGLYGYVPSPHVPDPGLRRGLGWFTRVAQVRELRPGEGIGYGSTYRAAARERVATLPVGYADGFSRGLSNRGAVWIGGRRAPVRGRVCMDQVVVGLEECGPVAQGDVAVLLGDAQSADDLADTLGTISYEVLCAISARVPRLYVGR